MKRPLVPGTRIDAKRYKRWVDHFGSYRAGITNITIESWLNQFEASDQDLAARVLDATDYFGQPHIYAGYRSAFASLDGWHANASKRKGSWAFAAMSGSAGESGDMMLYHFRIANGLDSKQMDELFVSRTDLFRRTMLPDSDPRKLGADDVVVLLDDFSGTGTQICDAWNDPVTSFGALLAGVGKIYLIVVAASKSARKRIRDETDISLVPAHELSEGDDIFSEQCKHFSKTDRARLHHYCELADKKHPKGFGECGFVVVFQHRTPNNTIPILHVDHSKWTGLFPRHD